MRSQSFLTISSSRGQSNVFIDSIGDRDNVMYGRSSAGTRAKYRRGESAFDLGTVDLTLDGRLLGISRRYRAIVTGTKTDIGLEVAEAGLPYVSTPGQSIKVAHRLSSCHGTSHVHTCLIRIGAFAPSNQYPTMNRYSFPLRILQLNSP